MSNFAFIDFETYYDDECSVTELGVWGYLNHPNFDVYMVSVVTDTFEWVGDPRQFDWITINGCTLGAHNVGFDKSVLEFLMAKLIIPTIDIAGWFDTADLAAYLQAERNLKGAAKGLLGVEHSKEMRANAKGKGGETLRRLGMWDRMCEYALMDPKLGYEIWKQFAHLWPEHEQELSKYTREMCARGVPIDTEYLQECIEKLQTLLLEIYRNIPWTEEIDIKYKKPFAVTSKRALALHCRKVGIPVPISTAKTDEEFVAWVEQYKDAHTFVAALGDYRRVNTMLQKFEAIKRRLRADGFMPYGMKYFGAATTGRWSGDAGVNLQNLPRGEMFGCNLRHVLKAPEGYTFVSADLQAIEPRCSAYILGDEKLLEHLKNGIDIYEAHARSTMGYAEDKPLKRKEGDPDKERCDKIRELAKVRVLSLGYGTSWSKMYEAMKLRNMCNLLDDPVKEFEVEQFTHYAEKYSADAYKEYLTDTPEVQRQKVNAWKQVIDFRTSSRLITDAWRSLDNQYKASLGKTYEIELLSGRTMKYFNVRAEKDQVTCKTSQGSMGRYSYYSSKFWENVCQGTARDVFADALLRMYKSDINVVLHIHDEVLVLVKEEDAEEVSKKVTSIFATPPSWLSDCPLASSSYLTKVYTK
jgi:DNA polymerase